MGLGLGCTCSTWGALTLRCLGPAPAQGLAPACSQVPPCGLRRSASSDSQAEPAPPPCCGLWPKNHSTLWVAGSQMASQHRNTVDSAGRTAPNGMTQLGGPPALQLTVDASPPALQLTVDGPPPALQLTVDDPTCSPAHSGQSPAGSGHGRLHLLSPRHLCTLPETLSSTRLTCKRPAFVHSLVH